MGLLGRRTGPSRELESCLGNKFEQPFDWVIWISCKGF